MANVTQVAIDEILVEGEYDDVRILLSLDDINGALYVLYNSVDERIGVVGDKDRAIERACEIADEYVEVGDGPDYEPEDGMTDVEADADTLASAGYGCDEDYGYYCDEGEYY